MINERDIKAKGKDSGPVQVKENSEDAEKPVVEVETPKGEKTVQLQAKETKKTVKKASAKKTTKS